MNTGERKVYGPGDVPILTEDTVLAFALYLAFVPFTDETLPCINTYTIDQLRKLGYRGMLPLEAARKAAESGQKGTVQYMFRQPDDNRLVAIYHDQVEVLRKSEGLARDAVKNLLTDFTAGARDYEETIIRLVVTLIYMRGAFLTLWQQTESMLKIVAEGKPERTEMPDGRGFTLTHGGFKMIGVHASEETQRRMGL